MKWFSSEEEEGKAKHTTKIFERITNDTISIHHIGRGRERKDKKNCCHWTCYQCHQHNHRKYCWIASLPSLIIRHIVQNFLFRCFWFSFSSFCLLIFVLGNLQVTSLFRIRWRVLGSIQAIVVSRECVLSPFDMKFVWALKPRAQVGKKGDLGKFLFVHFLLLSQLLRPCGSEYSSTVLKKIFRMVEYNHDHLFIIIL